MFKIVRNNFKANSSPCFLHNDSKFKTLYACLSTDIGLFTFMHRVEIFGICLLELNVVAVLYLNDNLAEKS